MNIHEHQAKELLATYGVDVGKGFAAFTPDEAEAAAKRLATPTIVVKAQIHAGGRGKGRFKEPEAGDKGGVRFAKTPAVVRKLADEMLGRTLVTVQTGPTGRTVQRLYIQESVNIARELYLSALVDRASSRVAFIASTEGGMDIEKVAHETPEKILTLSVDPATGLQPFHARKIAYALGLKGDEIKACAKLVAGLYRFLNEKDVSLLEINPLVVTAEGQLVCLDAKVSFDGNALFRHPDILALRDETEEDPMEIEAAKHELSYVKLDGTIGCMVNGAGLAMATMDIIKLYGAEPANFLDVGGGASKEKVEAAFKIILSDPSVRGILVNIFGGIMRCDIIAEGIIAAAREMAITVPLVVRLEGTNVDVGKEILAKSGLKIVPADDLADAASKITTAIRAAA
ncbi:ADP-forming succinate--CoA ligase subunit beta [Hyphomicrobium sp.]|uniref:ADP-forming succinate--CoA ligase subunit beta n=1 Tax=Hyphomicrobium sp. TaxID=82 RepID=UPI002FDD494E